MKNNIKALQLIESGLSSKTVSKLTESQIDELHSKMVGEAVTTNVTKTTYSPAEVKGKSFQGTVSINPDSSVTVTKEGEMGESKDTKKEPNPWAICHAQLGPKKTRKFERCVREVKKSLKEGKNPVSLFLENEIMKMVERHIPPRITKSELIKYLTEDTTTAPVKPKTKPTTKPSPKPKPKSPGHNPNPGENPAPKAVSPERAKEESIKAIMKLLDNE